LSVPWRRAFWTACLAAACGTGDGGHERLGDLHYRDGAYAQAVQEYTLAQRTDPRPTVWGKLGAAALKAGDPVTAAAAYEQLALADRSRAAEAARGLERVVRAARWQGDQSPVLTRAVLALRRQVPERPLGALAGEADMDAPGAEALASLLPAAIAAAGGGAGGGGRGAAATVDRLLVRSGDALRARAACEDAVAVYRIALRRSRDLATRDAAGRGLADCALRLGLTELAANRLEVAEDWFAEAVGADPAGVGGLGARLGWGDARLRQGDVLGAVLSWEAVRSMPGVPDSLREQARVRISAVGSARRGGETTP
jgi:tetratricopeptide (TPR) repeat protein